MNLLRHKLLSGALLCAALSLPASASIILQTANDPAGNQTWGGVGLEFTVSTSLTVSELGIFDANQDGIAAPDATPLTAQLWENGSVLASAVFSVSSQGTLDAGSKYRFKSIAPVVLTSGNTYVLAGYGWSASDQEHNSNIGGLPDTFNGGGVATYINSRWTPNGSDPAGTFLSQSFAPGSPNFFSAANLTYDSTAAVPEPTTMFLMAGGFAALAGFRIRSKKRA